MKFLCTLVVLLTAASAGAVQPRFYLSTERVFAPGDQEVQVRVVFGEGDGAEPVALFWLAICDYAVKLAQGPAA